MRYRSSAAVNEYYDNETMQLGWRLARRLGSGQSMRRATLNAQEGSIQTAFVTDGDSEDRASV